MGKKVNSSKKPSTYVEGLMYHQKTNAASTKFKSLKRLSTSTLKSLLEMCLMTSYMMVKKKIHVPSYAAQSFICTEYWTKPTATTFIPLRTSKDSSINHTFAMCATLPSQKKIDTNAQTLKAGVILVSIEAVPTMNCTCQVPVDVKTATISSEM